MFMINDKTKIFILHGRNVLQNRLLFCTDGKQ